MSELQQKRYYWLKLKDDFFNSEDMKLVLAQKNGAQYAIFWQKLLLKAITAKEVGILRYKDSMPYSPEMLSTILDTDIDTVKSSLDLFVKLGMVGILPDGSFWLEEAEKMVGSETEGAKQKRLNRAKKQDKLPKNEDRRQCLPLSSNCLQEIEIEKEKDIEKDKKKNNLAKPSSSPKGDTNLFSLANTAIKNNLDREYLPVIIYILKTQKITDYGKATVIAKNIGKLKDQTNISSRWRPFGPLNALVYAKHVIEKHGQYKYDYHNNEEWLDYLEKIESRNYGNFGKYYRVNIFTGDREEIELPNVGAVEKYKLWSKHCITYSLGLKEVAA